MPLEVKFHTVSHLKALSSGIESLGCHWRGRTFLDTRLIWKVLILLHTEPIERFVLLLFVVMLTISKYDSYFLLAVLSYEWTITKKYIPHKVKQSLIRRDIERLCVLRREHLQWKNFMRIFLSKNRKMSYLVMLGTFMIPLGGSKHTCFYHKTYSKLFL